MKSFKCTDTCISRSQTSSKIVCLSCDTRTYKTATPSRPNIESSLLIALSIKKTLGEKAAVDPLIQTHPWIEKLSCTGARSMTLICQQFADEIRVVDFGTGSERDDLVTF